MTMQRRPIAGFTLTELAIVLGVIGIILGGIWTVASTVSNHNKINQAVRQITVIVENVRGLYGTRGSFPAYNGATEITTAMQSANVFPPELINSSNQLTNGWGGSVNVFAMDNLTFRVKYSGVTPQACLGIASQLIGSVSTNANLNSSSEPINLTTDSSQVYYLGDGFTSQQISDACKANNGSSTASVEFDYSVK